MIARSCSKSSKARLQQYDKWELPDVQAGFRKGRGIRDQTVNITGSQKKTRKTSTSASLTISKPSTVWITRNCGKFFKRWEYHTTWPASWEICIQVKKQELEPNMEQTGSKLGKECVKAVYRHLVYLTYMQSSVQLLSHVQLFATPWTTAHQASLSITNFQNLPKLISIEFVMSFNHLIVCHSLLLLPSIFANIRVFSNESCGQNIGVSDSTSVLPTQDWFPLGWTGWISLQSMGLRRIFSSTLRNMQSTSWKMLSWLNHKLELWTGRNINNLRYADDTTLMAESKEELKNLLMKEKREELKSWLKTQHSKNKDHGIQFHHFMAYG